jgi:hypothetical protein
MPFPILTFAFELLSLFAIIEYFCKLCKPLVLLFKVIVNFGYSNLYNASSNSMLSSLLAMLGLRLHSLECKSPQGLNLLFIVLVPFEPFLVLLCQANVPSRGVFPRLLFLTLLLQKGYTLRGQLYLILIIYFEQTPVAE